MVSTSRIRDLMNLGEKSEMMLNAAGINNKSELEQLGAIKAYLKVIRYNPAHTNLNLLYALLGALEGRHWTSISKAEKSELLMQLDGYQQLDEIFKEYE